ncbi:MAG: hypothetical protein IJ318_01630 [Clostridia bacterium]|nr:hypothetical protein [Clostridia bacterium]
MENDYLVLLHNLDAGASSLLGEFDASDSYVIADDIKQELIKANKLITEYKPDKITAKATAGSYSFDFAVYVQLGEQNKKRATLFLIEKCKLGFVEKEVLTLLKSVIVDGSQNLMNVVKKEFSLFVIDESEGIDMANANLKALLARMAQVASRSKFLVGELHDADKAYVLKMLGLIKGTGSYGTRLLAQFKNMMRAKHLDKNDPKYWNSLKNMLDKLLLDNSLLFNGKVKERMDEMQKGYRDMVLNAKEPKKEESKPKKKKGDDKKKKPKKIGAYEGVKFKPLDTVKPIKIDFGKIIPLDDIKRALTPPGSSSSRITSNPRTNSSVFSGLMSPIYTSNLDRSHRRRGRGGGRITPTPSAPTMGDGGMERM